MTPRSLKKAIESGWVIKSIISNGYKQIRVDLTPRFYHGGKAIISFWIDKKYFCRNYPNAATRHGI